eukprot:TRINITY_DN9361_c0_g1_i1.p1 TRINITY_DN9361_c0_g1~~TRINITY_DN9361_c0_g1_i1.p1  ORF type:complete len:340 (+),score=30.12 TRINITY_DN9361_c0_g1_i1:60-1022(+)
MEVQLLLHFLFVELQGFWLLGYSGYSTIKGFNTNQVMTLMTGQHWLDTMREVQSMQNVSHEPLASEMEYALQKEASQAMITFQWQFHGTFRESPYTGVSILFYIIETGLMLWLSICIIKFFMCGIDKFGSARYLVFTWALRDHWIYQYFAQFYLGFAIFVFIAVPLNAVLHELGQYLGDKAPFLAWFKVTPESWLNNLSDGVLFLVGAYKLGQHSPPSFNWRSWEFTALEFNRTEHILAMIRNDDYGQKIEEVLFAYYVKNTEKMETAEESGVTHQDLHIEELAKACMESLKDHKFDVETLLAATTDPASEDEEYDEALV